MGETGRNRCRSVVVTGCSTGIGEACAIRLAAAGWNVFAGVRREESHQDLLARGIDRLAPLRLDVTDPESVDRAAAIVAGRVGSDGIDGLVANAGIGAASPVEFHSIEEFRSVVEVNLVGAMASVRAFLPLLRRAGGRIVLVGSIMGRQGIPFASAYAATKWALVGLAQSLRLEIGPWGMTATVIEPGAIRTPIWDKARGALAATLERLGPDARELYGAMAESMDGSLAHLARSSPGPEVVARDVERVLTERRPPLRRTSGRRARALAAFYRLAPPRVRESFLARALRLPRYR